MTTRSAAIVTVGTELTAGMAVDTNGPEIALALTTAGIRVAETLSVPDDVDMLAAELRRLTDLHGLVVVTGGLGPTHDDVTREAASVALGIGLAPHESLLEALRPVAGRVLDARASEQILSQADVLDGAEVLPALLGTAPGQVVPTARGSLVLLPGPPREMRPMLETLAGRWRGSAADPVVLRCALLSESDAQLRTQDALAGADGIGLTVLAALGDIKVVLFDRGAGEAALRDAAVAAAAALGDACYSTDGSDLPTCVLAHARARKLTIATAESCTGGLVAAALTSVPGSSDVFLGGVVAYSDDSKSVLLGVDPGLIGALGAVSDGVAKAMAAGATHHLGSDLAVAVTGVAGPGGGGASKPVGTVWFATSDGEDTRAECRRFSGDRHAVRARSVVTALDLLRRMILAR